MGNKSTKSGKSLVTLEEQYTKPRSNKCHPDLNYRKLRKLILDKKLAPIYLGVEESSSEMEECPICALHFPSLNRSMCCKSGMCTECFLLLRTPDSDSPIVKCPFCNAQVYSVEYRGARTVQERVQDELEEQKVLEADQRMRQPELSVGTSELNVNGQPRPCRDDGAYPSSVPFSLAGTGGTSQSIPTTSGPSSGNFGSSQQDSGLSSSSWSLSKRKMKGMGSFSFSSGVQHRHLMSKQNGGRFGSRQTQEEENLQEQSNSYPVHEFLTTMETVAGRAEGLDVNSFGSVNGRGRRFIDNISSPLADSDDEDIENELLSMAVWQSLQDVEARQAYNEALSTSSAETWQDGLRYEDLHGYQAGLQSADNGEAYSDTTEQREEEERESLEANFDAQLALAVALSLADPQS